MHSALDMYNRLTSRSVHWGNIPANNVRTMQDDKNLARAVVNMNVTPYRFQH
jgi:hypothetical protein